MYSSFPKVTHVLLEMKICNSVCHDYKYVHKRYSDLLIKISKCYGFLSWVYFKLRSIRLESENGINTVEELENVLLLLIRRAHLKGFH